MNIIIPMAGMGKRMRPHTLTQPKPLIPVAGKPIVHRLVEDIAKVAGEGIGEIVFITGHFGEQAEADLLKIAAEAGGKGRIAYQDEPLGTGHAILCAGNALHGPVVVAFADTLFYADFKIDTSRDGIIWTKSIPNPQQFGVVQTDTAGQVVKIWEKPKEFVSDQAIIGIYYFRDGDRLKKELERLMDEDIKTGGEYGLTDALANMSASGLNLGTAEVTNWLDCGNKAATLETNQVILGKSYPEGEVSSSATLDNVSVIHPVVIGDNAVIKDSVIGPYVSIGEGAMIERCILSDAIVMSHATLNYAVLDNAMIGSYARAECLPKSPNLGNYSEL